MDVKLVNAYEAVVVIAKVVATGEFSQDDIIQLRAAVEAVDDRKKELDNTMCELLNRYK